MSADYHAYTFVGRPVTGIVVASSISEPTTVYDRTTGLSEEQINTTHGYTFLDKFYSDAADAEGYSITEQLIMDIEEHFGCRFFCSASSLAEGYIGFRLSDKKANNAYSRVHSPEASSLSTIEHVFADARASLGEDVLLHTILRINR